MDTTPTKANPVLQWKIELPLSPAQVSESISLAVAHYASENGRQPDKVWCNPKDFESSFSVTLPDRVLLVTPRGGCTRGYLWVF